MFASAHCLLVSLYVRTSIWFSVDLRRLFANSVDEYRLLICSLHNDMLLLVNAGMSKLRKALLSLDIKRRFPAKRKKITLL